MSDEIPRRCRTDLYIPEETAIRAVLIAVESLGAHPLLTDAVTLLGKAQGKVADWHDSGRPGAVLSLEETQRALGAETPVAVSSVDEAKTLFRNRHK